MLEAKCFANGLLAVRELELFNYYVSALPVE